MVLISSKKYACETCIKGHRSSSCKHTDRPLYEIKKKGRPVTQCEHCRELRKTKQVHVKCICTKPDGASTSSKGSNKMLESAAFPNGLPEALEASVALQLLSEGHSSDSDHAGGCSCHTGGECNCCVPRKSAPRRRKKEGSETRLSPLSSGTITPPNVASGSSVSRAADLRPVLPKPPSRRAEGSDGPVHELSSGHPHTHAARHHDAFSPYSRAYDYTYPPQRTDLVGDTQYNQLSFPSSTSQLAAPEDERASRNFDAGNHSPNPAPAFDPNDISLWYSAQSGAGDVLSSLCGCGEGCGCQGCTVHTAPSNSSSTDLSCSTQPNGGSCCNSCLNCSALSAPLDYPGTLPPNTALSIYQNPDPNRAVDEWVRQLDPSYSSATAFDLTSPGYVDIGMEIYTQMNGCRCPTGMCQCSTGSSGCGCGGCAQQAHGIVGQESNCCSRGSTPPVFDDGSLNIPDFYTQFNRSLEGILVDDILPLGQTGTRSRSSSSSSSSSSSGASLFKEKLAFTSRDSRHKTFF